MLSDKESILKKQIKKYKIENVLDFNFSLHRVHKAKREASHQLINRSAVIVRNVVDFDELCSCIFHLHPTGLLVFLLFNQIDRTLGSKIDGAFRSININHLEASEGKYHPAPPSSKWFERSIPTPLGHSRWELYVDLFIASIEGIYIPKKRDKEV